MERPLPTYIVNGDMAADVAGAAIDMAYSSELTLFIQTTATGTPNGLLSLQGSMTGASGWKNIPAAFAELPASVAGALAAQDIVCTWSDLNFPFVRLFWDAASGGTGATLNAQGKVR